MAGQQEPSKVNEAKLLLQYTDYSVGEITFFGLLQPESFFASFQVGGGCYADGVQTAKAGGCRRVETRRDRCCLRESTNSAVY